MKNRTIAAICMFALMSIPGTLLAGTTNPFNPDPNEYGLVQNGDGSLTFYGRLIPGDKFDNLPKFTDATTTNLQDPLKTSLKNEQILVWLAGPTIPCKAQTGKDICSLAVKSHCWQVQINDAKGNLFTCKIEKADAEDVKKLLSNNPKAFTNIWCQSARENASPSAQLSSPYMLEWAKLIANETKDTDKDGTPDYRDNCPDKANANQSDANSNGVGDVCENVDFSYTPPPPPKNEDNDAFQDDIDKCPGFANTSNADRDNDGVGDECDACPDQPGDVANKGCPAGETTGPGTSENTVIPKSADTGGGCSLIIH